ncbi:AAA-like domain-containing protein [Nostoc sp. CHAB 5824]|nr:AAA-like domain-containing protein [Nostoc sp. CHAB 5824]
MKNFDFQTAIKIANQAFLLQTKRNLNDVEIIVIQGAWDREEYDQMAAKHQYATSYISQDVAPKLWKILSKALGEKVKKGNLKEALKRYYEQQLISESEKINQTLSDSEYSPETVPTFLPTKINDATLDALIPDCYIERPPIESICYETLLQPGSLIRIKAPNLMGKTSLINRVLTQVAAHNYQTVSLSLELADRKTHFSNLDKFLRWFGINLSRELGLPNQLEDYWDEAGIGSKVSCTSYFEEYLLAQADSPLVLCLDDVDLLFSYPEIYEDFFGLLRSWYEKARSRQNWKKLRLVLAHSTDVYIRLNINQSPFNVGLLIELSEFTREQVQDFAQQYKLENESTWLELLMSLVGGHPYLLKQAFAYLKNHPDVTREDLLAAASTEAGIYGNHLREFWLNLQDHPVLAIAFQKVITSSSRVQLEPLSAYKLQSMGLVQLSGNEVEPRCQLYRQYFSARLGLESAKAI